MQTNFTLHITYDTFVLLSTITLISTDPLLTFYHLSRTKKVVFWYPMAATVAELGMMSGLQIAG